MVEQLTVNQLVAGSSPACGARKHLMIYRRKNSQKRKANQTPNHNKSSDVQPKQTKNPKKQRLIQVEAEIQELAHKSGYDSQEKIDKLMLERWQLRYQLNL